MRETTGRRAPLRTSRFGRQVVGPDPGQLGGELAYLEMLATLVRVPELDGTFLELETMVSAESELSAALDDVRGVLRELGIEDKDLTNELYTDAVAAKR